MGDSLGIPPAAASVKAPSVATPRRPTSARRRSPAFNLVAFLFDTGLRLGEAFRLEWQDVDWQRGTVTVRVSKTKRPRTVPFTKRGAIALKAALARRGDGGPGLPDRVFWDLSEPKRTGELNLRTQITKAWDRARKAAGLPTFRLHDCRHCWAATLLRAGVPPNDLAALGGWGSLAMVCRYGRHVPGNAGDLARERLNAMLERRAPAPEPAAATAESSAQPSTERAFAACRLVGSFAPRP